MVISVSSSASTALMKHKNINIDNELRSFTVLFVPKA